MIKTLPYEPPFGWRDEIPEFKDVWNSITQPCYVNESNQDSLWEIYMSLVEPTNQVIVRE